jgi:phytoene dehydrogenase-like protein
MNEYHTQIFELHNNPGGLCTSWKRKEYTFDGCLHFLVGSGSGSNMNRLWEELGAVQGRRMINHEEFLRIEGTGGKTLVFYTNIDQLEQHMKKLAPVDSQLIEELCNTIRILSTVDMPLDTPDQPPQDLEMDPQLLAFIEVMGKYSTISIQDTGARFSDPFLHWAFTLPYDHLPDFPTSWALISLAWMYKRDAGYPIGGSLAFSQSIERRYLDLGGVIHYKSRVQKIMVENGHAVGVRLEDGTEHRADVVISAGDGHATIFDMLDGKYISDEVRGYYRELPIFWPMIQVSLGVARDFSSEPHMVIFTLDEPITIAGKVRKELSVKHYCYDPTIAPAGKSVLAVLLVSDYEYWKRLREERDRYKAEKRQISDMVVAQLEKRFPGIGEQIEVVDVATPMTYERFTDNWRGSMEGWLFTTKTVAMMMGPGMSKTLPGLDSFYMAGQWVEPGGGVPTAAMSGRKVMRMICEADEKPFITTTP